MLPVELPKVLPLVLGSVTDGLAEPEEELEDEEVADPEEELELELEELEVPKENLHLGSFFKSFISLSYSALAAASFDF